ncbi:MAG: hypothetical protein DRJ64_08325 [Thermoprotei archaeon]|nr:MAG: hypothetical protein DRJ64_08325 [Thermoprotei archaeon]
MLKENMSVEETKVIKPVLQLEIIKAKEQLQALHGAMEKDSFILEKPDSYTLYQRLFISTVMGAIHNSYKAMEAKDEANKQTAS